MSIMLEHLKSRWFDPSRYNGVWVEPNSVTLALWNMSGQMVGYQKYQPGSPRGNGVDARYYSFFGEHKLGVWGLETVDLGGTLFLTEGVFDACRLHAYNLQAVAVVCNNPKHLKNWLSMLPHFKVAALDGDVAGDALSKYVDKSVKLPHGKDVGDLTQEEFLAYFGEYL